MSEGDTACNSLHHTTQITMTTLHKQAARDENVQQCAKPLPINGITPNEQRRRIKYCRATNPYACCLPTNCTTTPPSVRYRLHTSRSPASPQMASAHTLITCIRSRCDNSQAASCSYTALHTYNAHCTMSTHSRPTQTCCPCLQYNAGSPANQQPAILSASHTSSQMVPTFA
jgi:hypothetical protein